jgi:hypothetical protein
VKALSSSSIICPSDVNFVRASSESGVCLTPSAADPGGAGAAAAAAGAAQRPASGLSGSWLARVDDVSPIHDGCESRPAQNAGKGRSFSPFHVARPRTTSTRVARARWVGQ